MQTKFILLLTFFFIAGVVASSTALGQSSKNGTAEFEPLFDGRSLENFRGYKTEEIGAGWKTDGKTLMFDGSGGGDLMTKKQYANFQLEFDWKVAKGSNSGVMYRVTTGDGAPYLSGPEYQILDDDHHQDGKNEMTSAGSLYAMYAPVGKELQSVGEWNHSKIILDGNRVEHWLNGKRIVSANIGSPDWQQRLGESKFKTWEKFAASETGHICFQDHGDKVWFRDIKVKTLK